MARKELTTVNFDTAQLEALRALAKRTSVSMAEYVRRGVDLVLEMENAKGEED